MALYNENLKLYVTEIDLMQKVSKKFIGIRKQHISIALTKSDNKILH